MRWAPKICGFVRMARSFFDCVGHLFVKSKWNYAAKRLDYIAGLHPSRNTFTSCHQKLPTRVQPYLTWVLYFHDLRPDLNGTSMYVALLFTIYSIPYKSYVNLNTTCPTNPTPLTWLHGIQRFLPRIHLWNKWHNTEVPGGNAGFLSNKHPWVTYKKKAPHTKLLVSKCRYHPWSHMVSP